MKKTMDKVRILLADDHTLFREGIRSLLERMPNVEIVGETADGKNTVEAIEANLPDVVLLDISMPGLNGIEAISMIRRKRLPTKVMILTMHGQKEYVYSALENGALGYVMKDDAWGELEAAIDEISRGGRYISASLMKYVTDYFVEHDKGRKKKEPSISLDGQLTARQREILQLIAEGFSTKEVAARLNLSTHTVDTHRTEIMRRLGVHDVVGLVRYAIRMGYIDP